MVILGGMLLGVTLKHPPYGGPSGSDAGGNPWRLRANQLRVCVDIGMLWIYICALIAVLAHAGDRASDGRLRHTASIRIAMLIHITAINGGAIWLCATLRAGVNKAVSSILLMLMLMPSAAPVLVLGYHYCWDLPHRVCCRPYCRSGTKYSRIDRESKTSARA